MNYRIIGSVLIIFLVGFVLMASSNQSPHNLPSQQPLAPSPQTKIKSPHNYVSPVAQNTVIHKLSTDNHSNITPTPPENAPQTPPDKILHSVPFTPQAPFAQWHNRTFQDACEEASLLMAMSWINNTPIPNAQFATDEIQKLSDFQKKHYGYYLDVSLTDLMRTIVDYYHYTEAQLLTNMSLEELIAPLYNNSVVIVTVNGKKLHNPHFSNGGPERHALVIIGYDPTAKEFITNDPGTRHGKSYHYKQSILFDALRDYPSGDHQPFPQQTITRAIVLRKK